MNSSDRIYRDLRIARILDRLIFAGFLALMAAGVWELVKYVATGKVL